MARVQAAAVSYTFLSAQARFAYIYEKRLAPVDIAAVFTLRTPRIWLFGSVEVV